MKYKNSFFRIEIKENGTYLDLFPKFSDGKSIEIGEIINFLDDKNITDYNIQVIQKALNALDKKPVRIKITDTVIDSFNESAVVKVTPDRMIAYARFYPPSSGGKLMTAREILSEFTLMKITTGISEKVIELFLQNRQYCVNIPIARGTKPVVAKDTQIEYFFDTRPLAKPKMLEDGSVDFHELNLFTKVNKGQRLAKLTMHEEGKNGIDVYGNPILTNKPKVKYLKHGRNIELSEDKTELTSMVDGDVTINNDTVFVSDTYKVAADVDASTGDINYEGSIFIPGTVRTGFTVKAKGDIQVNGVVEGATLIAEGNIVIKRGVQGMNKGKLIAGGDICAQFFESANVEVAGNVNAGSILHSNVKCGGNVEVSGKKGFIVGGEIVCSNLITVHTIGNKMETQTVLKVGVKPELIDELKILVARTNELNESIEENSSYLNVYRTKLKKGTKLSPENLKQIKVYTASLEELKAEKEEKDNRMQEIRAIMEAGAKGCVKVSGDSYVGVSIFIASRTYTIKEKLTHCTYRIVDGEIEATPL